MSRQKRPTEKSPKMTSRELFIRIMAGILCFLMVFSIIVVAIDAYASMALDLRVGEEVDVGLYYGENLAEGFTAETEKGFLLEIPNGKGVITFDEAREVKNISVASGSTLLKEGGIYVDTDVNTDVSVGGYRVMVSSYSTKVGGSAENDNIVPFLPMTTTTVAFDKENINGYIKRISDTVEKLESYAFPAYLDGKYYICLGAFESTEEAERFLDALGEYYVCEYTINQPDKNAYSVIDYQTNRVVFHFSGINSLTLTPLENNGFTSPSGDKYYGRLHFEKVGEKGFEIINTLFTEEYVASRLACEVDTSWNSEVLKAVATVIRTNAYSSMNKLSAHYSEGFDFCADAHCGGYHGCADLGENAIKAVKDTENEVIKSNGKLINAIFDVSNAGETLSLADAYGSAYSSKAKYLTSHVAAWEDSRNDADLYKKIEIAPYELYEILSQRIADCPLKGNVGEINVKKHSGAGIYVTEIEFSDIFGNKLTLSGSEVIRNILSGVVPSAAFSVGKAGEEINENVPVYNSTTKTSTVTQNKVKLEGDYGNFVFVGYDVGSGLGLSLNGANDLASKGYSYEDAYIDILKAYYDEITVEKIKDTNA